MADEVNASFMLPGEPGANISAWRADPPPFLDAGGYAETDASYESLVYEANVTTGFAKVVTFGFGKTLYRLTFTFRPVDGATRVNMLGQIPERTRGSFTEWVAGIPRS